MSEHTRELAYDGTYPNPAGYHGEISAADEAGTFARVNGRDAGEAEYYARLFVAAPDLLAALKPFAELDIEHAHDKRDDEPMYGVGDTLITFGDIRRARAAIAKAEEVTA